MLRHAYWVLAAVVTFVGCTDIPRTNRGDDDDDGTAGVGAAGSTGGPGVGSGGDVSAGVGGSGVGGMPTSGPTVAVLGDGTHDMNNVEVVEVATSADGLLNPRDLAINPAMPSQLWVMNYPDHSAVIVHDVGLPSTSSERHAGNNSAHFLARPAGIAFGANGFFATAQDTDKVTQSNTPADFMGPTLWRTQFFDAGHNSHMDMLHNSPLGCGIAWEQGNVYWVFDGYHSSLTRYDFNTPHQAGGTDHSDGVIERYASGQVKRFAGAPSNMFFDEQNFLLYVADTGNSRIAVLDTTLGAPSGGLSPNYDQVTQTMIQGAMTTTLVDTTQHGFSRPAGMTTQNALIFVSDFETSNIYAFDYNGELVDWLETGLPSGSLMGMDIDPQGRLYIAHGPASKVLRISALD